MVCEWTVHGEVVLQRHPLSSLFFWASLSLGLGWLHPDQQRAPVAIPLFSAIADSVRQDQVAGICSRQTKTRLIPFVSLLLLFYYWWLYDRYRRIEMRVACCFSVALDLGETAWLGGGK